MLWRHSHLSFLLALVSPLLASSFARAQGVTPPTAATAAPNAPPSSTASSSPAALPPLIPDTQPTISPSAPPPASLVNPARDQQELAAQGARRPASTELPSSPQDVFSDDWWGKSRPIIELHGYFRTRAELFHNFSLGRHGSAPQQSTPTGVTGSDAQYLFPIPVDNTYTLLNGTPVTVAACGSATSTVLKPSGACQDKTVSGANLRLRLDPEIHISDNLRIVTQINLLDNLVLGSTPDSYAMQPATSSSTGQTNGQTTYPTGYQPAPTNGYAPVGLLANTQGPPTAGVNGWTNSIDVTRVWGEYMTPVGQLRFGRMPGHWGLGMVENSGDGLDSDYQTTLDRVMFVTGIKSIDLYFGGAWDFVSTGPNSTNPYTIYGGQPYNTCNLCNVNEWAAFIAHKTNPDLQRLSLSRGDIVLNGGLYTVFRSQYVDVPPGQTPQTTDFSSNTALEPRQAWTLTPDLWVQLLWEKLRVEVEAATIQGQIGYMTGVNQNANNAISVQQYGVAAQSEYRAIEDKLRLQFGFGWASGDPWATTLAAPNGLRTEANQSGPIATFAFHPDYRVDLIFYRHILSRVEGSYYFRPSVDYDFIRHPDGEKLGGGAAVIWSRASEFIQTPGHASDLGVELDATLYYQSKDGSLNDDPNKIGGFYTMLQYGVFFPLGGLNYLPGEVTVPGFDAGLSAAQTARLVLGIVF